MHNPFWDFSLDMYARPGMAAACLRLQDEAGLDVNVLLFCLFAGANGRALGVDDFDALEAVVLPWQRLIVLPLRHARTVLKASKPDKMPAYAASLELLAEQRQQEMMAAAVPVRLGIGDLELCGSNLSTYVSRAAVVPINSSIEASLQAMCRAAQAGGACGASVAG